MKKLMIAALAAGQIAAAQPALAAGFGEEPGAVSNRQGAFAGARVRIPLDGSKTRKAQAGLTIAPMLQGRGADGSIRTRFGEGFELRLSGGAQPQLAIGGRSLTQLKEGRTGPDGRKQGISTIGWVAIGVGVAAVVVFALFESCKNGDICGSE